MGTPVIDLTKLTDGQPVSGLVCVKSYTKRAYGDGKKHFIVGDLMQGETQMAFKIWEGALVDIFAQYDYANHIVVVNGVMTSYQGRLELKISGISNPTPQDLAEHPAESFMPSADIGTLWVEFSEVINSLPPKEIQALSIIFGEENLYDVFKTAHAAAGFHDALRGGLLNHTLKMLRIAKTLYENDIRLAGYVRPEQMYIAVILHDIGKVREMKEGVYTPLSYVTHHAFGIEMLVRHEKELVPLLGQDYYYQLMAVILEHHGEFECRPRTLLSYLVHLVDMLDSQTTGVLDRLVGGKTSDNMSGQLSVRAKDFTLVADPFG